MITYILCTIINLILCTLNLEANNHIQNTVTNNNMNFVHNIDNSMQLTVNPSHNNSNNTQNNLTSSQIDLSCLHDDLNLLQNDLTCQNNNSNFKTNTKNIPEIDSTYLHMNSHFPQNDSTSLNMEINTTLQPPPNYKINTLELCGRKNSIPLLKCINSLKKDIYPNFELVTFIEDPIKKTMIYFFLENNKTKIIKHYSINLRYKYAYSHLLAELYSDTDNKNNVLDYILKYSIDITEKVKSTEFYSALTSSYFKQIIQNTISNLQTLIRHQVEIPHYNKFDSINNEGNYYLKDLVDYTEICDLILVQEFKIIKIFDNNDLNFGFEKYNDCKVNEDSKNNKKEENFIDADKLNENNKKNDLNEKEKHFSKAGISNKNTEKNKEKEENIKNSSYTKKLSRLAKNFEKNESYKKKKKEEDKECFEELELKYISYKLKIYKEILSIEIINKKYKSKLLEIYSKNLQRFLHRHNFEPFHLLLIFNKELIEIEDKVLKITFILCYLNSQHLKEFTCMYSRCKLIMFMWFSNLFKITNFDEWKENLVMLISMHKRTYYLKMRLYSLIYYNTYERFMVHLVVELYFQISDIFPLLNVNIFNDLFSRDNILFKMIFQAIKVSCKAFYDI